MTEGNLGLGATVLRDRIDSGALRAGELARECLAAVEVVDVVINNPTLNRCRITVEPRRY